MNSYTIQFKSTFWGRVLYKVLYREAPPQGIPPPPILLYSIFDLCDILMITKQSVAQFCVVCQNLYNAYEALA